MSVALVATSCGNDDDDLAAVPTTTTGAATATSTTTTLAPTDLILQLPPEFEGTDVLGIDGLLDKAAAEELTIWVWPNDASTQENPDFYAGLIDLGIGGVIAGHPEQAVDRFRADGDIPD